MNPEMKAKWIAALRSGDYQQGSGRLRRDHKFCCLGVLCDVLAERWRGETYDSSGTSLSTNVMAQVGMGTNNRLEVDELIGLNDEGTSFSDIADYIEEHL